jgi:hypothetical protein
VELLDMETDKVITYCALAAAGLVGLIFLLDLTAGIFGGRHPAMDILFLIGSGLLLWQGVETMLELR